MQARLLLPFRQGVDMCTIEQAILFAKYHEAVLIPLALISLSEEQRAKGARLEDIQQAKDFLEAAKYKAASYDVPVERLEVFTSDVVQSIDILAQEMRCEGILLFMRNGKGILLDTNEIMHVLGREYRNVYLIHLQPKAARSAIKLLTQRLFNWIPGIRKTEARVEPQEVQECLEEEAKTPLEAGGAK